jgi:hypothetical protein
MSLSAPNGVIYIEAISPASGTTLFVEWDMKLMACCAAVLLAALTAAETDADQVIKDLIAGLKEQRVALKAVKNKDSAEAALPKLKALAERQEKVVKALQGLSRQEEAALREKHKAMIEGASGELEKEFARVEAFPAAYAVLRTSPLFEQRRQEKGLRTRLILKDLDKAVQAYKLIYRDYPVTLDVLTQPRNGKPAFLELAALKDPWGRPFVYQPTILHVKTRKPRIYSHGADPKDKKGRISNW